jgi:hypothetical protein
VPSLHSEYPLNQLDGLNVWYEAQLLEEGVEDMQNLATANLIDVILHTRVPVGRLIDWVDQSYLYLRLPPKAPGRTTKRSQGDPSTPMNVRDALRVAGFKDATSLESIVPATVVSDDDKQRIDAVLTWVSDHSCPGTCPAALRTAAILLRDDPGLDLVRNWRRHGRVKLLSEAMLDLEHAANGNGAVKEEVSVLH